MPPGENQKNLFKKAWVLLHLKGNSSFYRAKMLAPKTTGRIVSALCASTIAPTLSLRLRRSLSSYTKHQKQKVLQHGDSHFQTQNQATYKANATWRYGRESAAPPSAFVQVFNVIIIRVK